jgi:hypothetical protein
LKVKVSDVAVEPTVPDITADEELSVRPLGKVPALMLTTSPVPPLIATACEYAADLVADGSVVVRILGTGFTVRVMFCVEVTPLESVTMVVKE